MTQDHAPHQGLHRDHARHASPTTHTVAMAQIDEVNERLPTQPPSHRLTAGDLGLGRSRLLHGAEGDTLPDSALLVRLCWEGPPEWPYIHGHFTPSPTSDLNQATADTLIVDLHTEALRTLSSQLNLRQAWES